MQRCFGAQSSYNFKIKVESLIIIVKMAQKKVGGLQWMCLNFLIITAECTPVLFL